MYGRKNGKNKGADRFQYPVKICFVIMFCPFKARTGRPMNLSFNSLPGRELNDKPTLIPAHYETISRAYCTDYGTDDALFLLLLFK